MSRWELLDTATAPGDAEQLHLYQRRDEFSLRIVGQGELMNSRTHGSEDALGNLGCARLVTRTKACVLIGGLGMGFTLSSALTNLASDARVVVAELVPEVIRWNRELLGHCAGYPLRDTRVDVREADVVRELSNATAMYDAILLDVDNGPEGLTRRANDRLYSLAGLANAHNALRPAGILAVWSAGRDHEFTQRLLKTGFAVDERRVRAHANKGARHTIWLATRE